MIAYSYIKNNLSYLDRSYRRSSSPTEANYSSKLAILELCGWIEVSMDDILLRASVRSLTLSSNRKFLIERVRNNYGFEYKRHFKSMLISLIGVIGYEKIEKEIPIQIALNFKTELGNLKERRNALAHTYVRGATPNYDAPSITVSRFQKISTGLQAYDMALRQYC